MKYLLIAISFSWLLFSFVHCYREHQKVMPQKPIEQVLKEHTDSLMAIQGVVGVGEGELDGRPCIVVFLADDREELRARIPKEIEDYIVKVEVTGEFRALEQK